MVSGVRDLLDDACTVLPALGEYELAECEAGLRPMTPDNLPLVQRLDSRTLVAAGHGRSGFLLAPWTAEQIVSNSFRLGPPHDRRCQRATGRGRRADHHRRAAGFAGLRGPGYRCGVELSVLPRSDWATKICELRKPVRLEVVTAVQGG